MGTDNPQPKSKRGTRRWIARANAYRIQVTTVTWQQWLDADEAFSAAQAAVAAVPIAGPVDLYTMASASVIYDAVKIPRHNRAPIARGVADHLVRLGMVLS